ncbi:fluoride efflux transporter CrcB [Shouchella patagoniensis]|uniref:fluoride efflux transporter CrcB n=1 Tax=Shouchella patagoniensis TaxID=228576 RepID=UPI0009958582|nr:fluoride efflux transporter CrcB [Shouchella patagoniensis]
MKQLCIYAGIGLGGAIGSSLRYLLTILLPFQQWPVAILTANLSGCFLMGLLTSWFNRQPQINRGLRLSITVGCIGGYTTMSTFTADAFTLIRAGRFFSGGLYVLVTVLGGITLIWVGHVFGTRNVCKHG